LEIHENLLGDGLTKDGFRASQGWCQRFIKRNGLCNRRRTAIAQRVPNDCIDKLVNFVIYLRKQMMSKYYSPSCVYAADETSVWFDNPSETTLEFRGANDVPLRSTGHDKMRLTVMLCAKSDGTKCKPFVLLNRKRPVPSLDREFSSFLILQYAGRSWMDDELIIEFLNKVLGKLSFHPRMLVWDSFLCHKSPKVKDEMKKLKVESVMIPGGCTRYIQAPDVSWNWPFKNKIKEQYNEWLSGDTPKTKYGNPAPPPIEIVCRWIKVAWDNVSTEIIKNSFKLCGISNRIDGSEDDLIQCFKSGEPCEGGREILRKKNSEINNTEILITEEFEDRESDSFNNFSNIASDSSDEEIDFT
jgi:hypothetical protein